MSSTLRTDILVFPTQQEQILKFDTNPLSDLEQTIEAFFLSKMHIQEPSIPPYKKQETISIKEPAKRFEVSRRTLYKKLCKPRKIEIVINNTNKIAPRTYKKYSLEFKQKAVGLVFSGICKNQVSKRFNISYNTLRNWTKTVSCSKPT